MCTSKAAVVYGLALRSTSLYFAVDAWSRLEKTLPFFDLVSLRRRLGTLKTSVPGKEVAVTKVPEELWEEIKFWLAREEVAIAEDKLVSTLRCDFSDRNYDNKGYASRKRRTWEAFCKSQLPEWVDDAKVEWICEEISNWRSDGFSETASLISHFGLALGSRCPITTEDFYDPDAFALVTAPSRFLEGESPIPIISAKGGGNGEVDEHTIVNVSVDLPSDIDRRFTRLVRLFKLEVVEAAINEISGRPEWSKSSKKAKGKTSAMISGVGNKVTKKIKPRWILWTTYEGSW